MASLSINGVTKTFGKITAVDRLELDVRDGELLVLVGPSGCGKTTILRMIAGLESPTSGAIQIDGRDVSRIAPRNRNVAMVFQDNALYPHMSVRDNLAFGLKNRGSTTAQIDSHIAEVSQQLEIQDILSRLPGEISGGQQQRVALGRAMVQRPSVYLFDEPLSDLDADLRTKLRSEIKRLHQRLGQTMVYVTHDQTEAMTLADRIVVLKEGRVQQLATPHELYNQPNNCFVATFIGSPPMNFFAGEIRSSGDGAEFVGDGIHVPLGNQVPLGNHVANEPARVLLGVRPEHISFNASPPAMSATVELVEFAGANTYVHLTAGETKLIASHTNSSRSNDGHPPTRFGAADIGTTTKIGFGRTAIHLFDPESGKRL